ncbi:MAG: DEAD/DEAH box helicase [Actinomycetota bacterium]
MTMTTTFADLGVPDDLVAVLAKAGITTPFPIQSAVIPDAIAGRDVCGRAPTGSGKTIAFGLPMMATVGKGRPAHPRALVLAPTRELAEQIARELIPRGKTRRRFVGVVYGGVGYGGQIQAMRRGVDVLVACPGRLLDLIEQRHVDLSEIEIAVIDEADRMADMGFLPDVKRILGMTPPARRTWMFSATLDGAVGVLTKQFQRDPVRHDVGEAGDTHGNARHFFWKVGADERPQHTAAAITASAPAIVFCRTRHGADRLTKRLGQLGVRAVAIHGGRSQAQRMNALRGFSDGRVQALVATDVAARGIHVDGVATVIHFDPPEDAKAYLHRSGRTARAGAPGVVLSLVSDQTAGAVRNLQKSMGLDAPIGRPDAAGLTGPGHRIDPEVRPRPKVTTGPRPRAHAGKNRRRTRKPGHQYWG